MSHRALTFTVQWSGHMARAPSVVMTTGTRFGALAGSTHSEANGVDVEAKKWGKRSPSDGGEEAGEPRHCSLEYPDTPSGRCAESPTSQAACWGHRWRGSGTLALGYQH